MAAPGLRPRPLRTAPALGRSSGGPSAPSPPDRCPPHLDIHTLSPEQAPPRPASPPGPAPPHLSVSTGTPQPHRPESFVGCSSWDTGEREEDGSARHRRWPRGLPVCRPRVTEDGRPGPSRRALRDPVVSPGLASGRAVQPGPPHSVAAPPPDWRPSPSPPQASPAPSPALSPCGRQGARGLPRSEAPRATSEWRALANEVTARASVSPRLGGGGP